MSQRCFIIAIVAGALIIACGSSQTLTPSSAPTSTPTPPPPTYTPEPAVATAIPTPTNSPTPMAMATSTQTTAPTAMLTNAPPTATPAIATPTPPADVWPCPQSTAGAAFVGSNQSDKYHYPTCRWAKKILPENRLCFASAEAARAAGYVPCGVCKPP